MLKFLNRNATQKDRDLKIGRNKGSYLQNFDHQFKHIEDDEIVKMYLGKEDTYETGDSVEYLHRDERGGGGVTNQQKQGDPKINIQENREEDNAKPVYTTESDRKPKMSHQELTRMIQER